MHLIRGGSFLSKCKPCDIIHYQQSSPFSFGFLPLIPLILIPTSSKKVITIHSLDKTNFPKLLSLVYNKADAIIVHSESLKSEIVAMGIDPSRIRLIPHGVTIPPVLSKNRYEITFFGAPVKHKGAFVLLEALKILKENGEKTKIHFYGICSASEIESFLTRARELGVSEDVVWGGRLSEHEFDRKMQSSMFTFAIYVAPVSGSSIVTRAMANAAPIITTGVGGLAEYLKNFAIIIPPNDPKALASAISRLKDDSKLRAQLGKLARTASYSISWENVSKRNLEVYLDVLNH